MYEITTSIELAAPAGRVWDLITSFSDYEQWNPVMTRMQATLTKGAPIAFMAQVGGRAERVRGELFRIDP